MRHVPCDETPLGTTATIVPGGHQDPGEAAARLRLGCMTKLHLWFEVGGSPAGKGSAPAALRSIHAVRVPTGGRVCFLTGRTVLMSMRPCKFSATKSAQPGGLCTYKASVCPNLFWQREAE